MKADRILISRVDYSRIHKSIDDALKAKKIGANEAETLLKELHSAQVVEPGEIPDNVVTMNSVVKVTFLSTNKTIKFEIVYPEEADIKKNKISIFSPVATALIGYKVSDEIEWLVPSGPTRLRIEEIVYQPEAAGNYHL
jgi:regulator of nucleoside diphosphate kinase